MDRALDRVAAGLSTLCVVHCLAGSALLVFYAPLSGFLSHDVHEYGLALAVPLALYALIRGARVHGRFAPLAVGGVGLALMAAGMTMAHGGTGEFALTAIGAALVALAHVLNLRRCAEIAQA